jgi:DNA-directed RNA polymerase I, II, and III subunit RPABC1
MDINRILFHAKELLELRGEDGNELTTEIEKVKMDRFMNESISVQLKNYTLFFAISKDSFKELWANIRNMTLEEMEKMYKTKKFLMILGEYPPSITLQALHQKDVAFQANQGFIHIFLTKELMYNPNKHFLVPKHEKLTEEEAKKLIEELQLKTKIQLPFIQKTDIISRWIGLKQGDIIRITRYSETSGEYYYYRICI